MARFGSAVVHLTVLCLTVLVVAHNHKPVVTPQCLSCMCEAISSCDTTAGCNGAICGAFRITLPYWIDSGKPTVNNESMESPTAFENCAHDARCSSRAVQDYMTAFQQDCNGDGIIDCDDFLMIHKLGAFNGCRTRNLTGISAQRYRECKAIVGV